jgi:hypothetical protein
MEMKKALPCILASVGVDPFLSLSFFRFSCEARIDICLGSPWNKNQCRFAFSNWAMKGESNS